MGAFCGGTPASTTKRNDLTPSSPARTHVTEEEEVSEESPYLELTEDEPRVEVH